MGHAFKGLQQTTCETMNVQGRGNNEMALRKLSARREEIAREMGDDISEIREDLVQLVSEFTCVLSLNAESIQNSNFNRISDVEQQIRRLNESNMTMSTFTDILHQFNSLTSKILTIDSSMLLGSNDIDLDSSTEREATSDRKTAVTVTPSHTNVFGAGDKASPHHILDKQSLDIQNELTLDHHVGMEMDGVDPSKSIKKRNISETDVTRSTKLASKPGGLGTGVVSDR